MKVAFYIFMLWALSPATRADSWQEAHAKATASPDSNTIIRIEPGVKVGDEPTAHIFHLSGDRKSYVEQEYFNLKNFPYQIAISNGGYRIATLDTYGNLGNGDSVVVIYDSKGHCLKKWRLEDIFSQDEIAEFWKTSSSIHWAGFIDIRDDAGRAPILRIRPYVDLDQPRLAPFHAVMIDLEKLTLGKF